MFQSKKHFLWHERRFVSLFFLKFCLKIYFQAHFFVKVCKLSHRRVTDYEEILHLSKVLLQLGLSYMLTADERRMVDTAQALQSHLGQPDAHFRAEYRQGLEQDARTLYFQIWQDADYFELP